MTKFIDENDMAIAMAVVSTVTMMVGFILGFSLSYLEKELVVGEIHELLDRAIEKKFERDEYVSHLENTIIQIQSQSEENRAVKRKRANTTESCDGDIEEPIINVPPTEPLERCVGRCISDKSEKDPTKED